MATISDLSQDLAEEILSRLPLTFLRKIRFTCKKWNDLSKHRSFTKKQISVAKKRQSKDCQAMIMVMNFRVYLTSVNLLGTGSNVYPSIKRQGTLMGLNDANRRVDISTVFHCDGLLLCITKDLSSRLVVCNPYLGQTMWIKPRNSYHEMDSYALGYDKSLRSYKILRFVDYAEDQICEFELYSLETSSWKVLDVTPDWDLGPHHHRGLSLKGNAYWYAKEKGDWVAGDDDVLDFLICFDFTRERFGPRLPLPNGHTSRAYSDATVTLSSFGEDQLAMLFQCKFTFWIKIWVTSKIEPEDASVLPVNMIPLTGHEYLADAGSFFMDEKTNILVVSGKVVGYVPRCIAHVVGKMGHSIKVDAGELSDPSCCPVVCSYVPSSVQIKQVLT